ncbi:TonB-dependent receptor [Carboxylicivirga sp. N1Y90]|uniref:TonB-dependent receptor n=1 Tax=Carboxylicivirga fragile TaxID=3417571 RepID=UPI003D330E99|nr:hypothetical protein [Marinilabiliaceae bacterium N1Y90]
MRLSLLLSILTFAINCTCAQVTIKGQFISNSDQLIKGISILVHEASNANAIITYGFSDEQGKFELKVNSKLDTLAISTRSLNYRDTTLIISNRNQELSITLINEVQQIKEVSVRGTPIISKDDTTKYIVSAFEKKSDESIGDVIDRMPGFTVDSKGKISYMGRPIDKYYIEGMDLLEGRYSIANKNLSNKAVGSVEVLHNHQPIKMLRKKQFHDGTSVNIKLKKKYTTTFRGEAALGLPWPRYSLNVTPMLFSPKHQMIASLQANNTGRDLSTQHHPFTLSYSEIDNYTNTKPNLLNISSVAPPGISNNERFLYNQAALISFNYLSKLSDDEELKTNVSYFNDRIEEKALVESEYYLETDTTRLSEYTFNRFKKSSIITDLIYTNNASQKYVNNKFRLENYWDKAESSINDTQQKQQGELPHFSIANELDWHRMVNKHFISFKAFVDYNHSPQSMNYQPGVFNDYINNGENYTKASQHYLKEDLLAKASAAFTLSHKRWAFATKLYANMDINKLQTTIDKNNTLVEADSLRNQMDWLQSEFGVDERITYETQNLRLRFNLPLSYVHYNINDDYHLAGQNIKQTLFAPRAYLNYQFLHYFKFITSGSISKSLGEVDKLTQGFVIKNYRSLGRGTNLLPQKYRISYLAKGEFKNPLSGWFASLDYRYSLNHSDVILRQISLGNGIFQSEALPYDNETIDNTINAELTYYIAKWRSTIGINTFNNYRETQYVLNSELSDRNSKTNQIALDINWGFWKALQVKYKFKYSQSKQVTTQASSQYYNRDHSLDFFFYLSKTQWVNLRGEYTSSLSNGQSQSTYFGDLTYAYKPKKGKLSYKIQCRNIFNADKLINYWNSDISFVRNTYYLRPREILLNVSYRF